MAKAALLLCALAVLILSFLSLRSHVVTAPYTEVVEGLSERSVDLEDRAWLRPFLALKMRSRCAPGTGRTRAILGLYGADLAAAEADTGPFGLSVDPGIAAARATAREALYDALACNPHDGDLWLRLALLERSMEAAPDLIRERVLWSTRTMPHEAWVAVRRDRAFPDLAASGFTPAARD